MAKKNTKETKTNDFIEFNFEGENGNVFNGRIWEGNEKDKCTIYPLSITINGLAILGSKLFITKDKEFISMPNYKTSGGEYKSICYFYNKEDIKDLSDLASHLKSLL